MGGRGGGGGGFISGSLRFFCDCEINTNPLLLIQIHSLNPFKAVEIQSVPIDCVCSEFELIELSIPCQRN